mmetsp:Transcript_2972/g.4541  ORF Transcript_2972/g.4541 Transcript_2972/m.4541 type:complete len:302 (+) Transcript_2972:44-949(+)
MDTKSTPSPTPPPAKHGLQFKHMPSRAPGKRHARRFRNAAGAKRLVLVKGGQGTSEREEPVSPTNDHPILPAEVRHILKPHQIDGVIFLWRHLVSRSSPGCLLADFMGLGKTLQVLTVLCMFLSLMKRGSRSYPRILLITPATVIANWKKETLKWFPSRSEIQPYTYTSSNREATTAKWARFGGILLLGYETFRSVVEGYRSLKELLKPEILVLDEGHRLRSLNARLTVALSRIRSKKKIVITGYPLQTKLVEYWCMMNFIEPGVLGDLKNFQEYFVRPICDGCRSDSSHLRMVQSQKVPK